MVYGVCHRLLGNDHAAEDTFQATFLVLACKASSLRCRDSLAAWLHGVAVRITLNARRASQRHPIRQESLTDEEAFDACPDSLSHLTACELFQALEEEVQRLPRAYRLAVVLCSLEGLSQEEVAHQLGWTVGSVKGRLERGRARLRERLTRRGLTLAAVANVFHATSRELSAGLTARTVKSALAFTGAEFPSKAAVSGEVLHLAEHFLKGTTMFKWKMAVVLTFLLGMTALSAFALHNGQCKEDTDKKRPPVVVVDLNDGSRVVGRSASLKELRLKASFGEVSIPIEQVASLQFKDDQGTAVVRFHNGDQLTGTLDLKALGDLKVMTALGETTVPLKLVTQCKIEAAPGRAQVTARASTTGEQTDPNNPFLQLDKVSSWNSGGYAPAWIEADLGKQKTLDSINLVVNQLPNGETIHEIWVSDEPIGEDRAKAKLVHTLKGETEEGQELKYTFPVGSTARYVQILTTQSPSWVAWHSIDLQVR
jgi:RNA polymerase sigma factor (sigma-70 family)